MNLSLSEEILALLVCPLTKKPLRLATESELHEWTASDAFEGILIAEGDTQAYPIRDGFPIVVASEALTRKN